MRVFPFPIIVKVGKNLPCVVVVIVCLKRMIKFRTGIERLFGGAPRMHPTQFKEDVMIDDLFVYQREKIVYCRSFFTANLKNPVFFHLFSFHVPYGTSCGTGERFMGQGTVNACEGYKMATSKFLPSLVHFVRGFAAWAFRVPFIAYKLRTAGQGTVPCPMSHVFPGFSALLDRAWFLQPFSGAYPFFFRINRPLVFHFHLILD